MVLLKAFCRKEDSAVISMASLSSSKTTVFGEEFVMGDVESGKREHLDIVRCFLVGMVSAKLHLG